MPAETTASPENRSQAVAAFVGVLVERYGFVAEHARAAVSSELTAGRIVERDGRLVLVPEAFAPGVLAALRACAPARGRDGSSAARRRTGSLGWGAARIADLSRLAEASEDHRPALTPARPRPR